MATTNKLQSIRERAYTLWEQQGRDHGRDLDYWLEAEREILGTPSKGKKAMSAARSTSTKAAQKAKPVSAAKTAGTRKKATTSKKSTGTKKSTRAKK
jgi:hypothetical protein